VILRQQSRGISNHFARRDTPWNTGLVVVPQQTAYVVERFGKFQKVMEPGLNFLIPLVHNIRYVYSLKEEALNVPSQMAITRDNVSISIDGVLYVKVIDSYKAAYGVEDPHFAITQLAQTTMRSEIGKISLDNTFKERETLNGHIVRAINSAALDWGISCMRYEIRDISPPKAVRAAMELEAEAERRKRALILDSEGEQEAEVNVAKGKKMAALLASEADMQERINRGLGEASAIEAKAGADAAAIKLLAGAISGDAGKSAMSLKLAEQYVGAFNAMAKSTNTVVVPANVGDAGAMVAQAMAILKTVGESSAAPTSGTEAAEIFEANRAFGGRVGIVPKVDSPLEAAENEAECLDHQPAARDVNASRSPL